MATQLLDTQGWLLHCAVLHSTEDAGVKIYEMIVTVEKKFCPSSPFLPSFLPSALYTVGYPLPESTMKFTMV